MVKARHRSSTKNPKGVDHFCESNSIVTPLSPRDLVEVENSYCQNKQGAGFGITII